LPECARISRTCARLSCLRCNQKIRNIVISTDRAVAVNNALMRPLIKPEAAHGHNGDRQPWQR
jgi:hypothetical protein